MQTVFHLQQLFRLGLEHLEDRDARPCGDDLCYVFSVNFIVYLFSVSPLFYGRRQLHLEPVELLFDAVGLGIVAIKSRL